MFILRKILVWQYLVKSEFHKNVFNDSTPYMSAVFTGCLPIAFLTVALHVIAYYEFGAKIVLDEIYLITVSTLTLLAYKFYCRHDEKFDLEKIKFDKSEKKNLGVIVWSVDLLCFVILGCVLYLYGQP